MNAGKVLLTILFGVASIGNSFGADSPVRFDGFYLGANLGYGAGKSSISSDVTKGNFFVTTDPTQIASAGDSEPGSNSWLGGMTVGYNKQKNNIVYGGELNFSSLNYEASRQGVAVYISDPSTTFYNKVSISADWLMTARGRVGYVVNRSLFYVTGGVATTRLKLRHQYTDNWGGGTSSASSSDTNTVYGWVLGLGYEHALQDNWSIRAEYLSTKFGNVTSLTNNLVANGASKTDLFNNRGDLELQLIQIGINKRW